MKRILREILAIIASMVLAFALVSAVEVFSSIVHPVPPEFTGTMDEMCNHVAKYPDWVLGVAVIAWSERLYSVSGSRRKLDDRSRVLLSHCS